MAKRLTTLGETIVSSGADVKLDRVIKRILAEKSVLGWILAYAVEEFKGMLPADVIPYIEGEPSVGTIPFMPGSSNSPNMPDMIEGMAQESSPPGEGITTYDVRFYAISPKGGETPAQYRLIINVEGQGREKPGYDPETRGIVYCARMLSEQLGRNVKHGHYEDMQKVYSIWIMMNCSQESANTISEVSLSYRDLAGTYDYHPRIDLERVVMIRLPKDGETGKAKNRPERIHEMLSTLLSSKVGPEEKLKTLDHDYHIAVTETLRKEVQDMCDYSDVIRDEGYNAGLSQGLSQGRNSEKEESARRMIRMGGFNDEQISVISDLPLSRVKELVREESLVKA